jgi:6-phosphogluconate dehydrogenase
VISTLKPYLEPGDILIDGGNSHFSDTDRRLEAMQLLGVQYIGMGVSGGEQGALWGSSIMPGGDEGTFHFLEPMLTKIAAKADNQEPCVTYIGRGSAGHFVIMVHNGIEYGDMQLIAEAYDILRFGLGLSSQQMAATFAGISLPAMSASLGYFEALRRDVLPANLIQAQRDFFGAHTYKRKDRDGAFQTAWPS